QFGVSRITVREAIGHLVYQGILRREQGRGTFVTQPKAYEKINELISYTQDMRNRGMKPSSKVLALKLERPSWEVMNSLRLGESDKVIKLARLRLADKEPMTIQTVYLSYNVCPEVYEKDFDWTTQSLNLVLKDLGFKVVSAVQRISADIANDLEAELLEIPSGSPLLIGEQISYLGNDKPIETLKSVYRADRYDIVVNLNQEKEEKD
ncbi:unnamed protein product, partial [marine sediment metagenome]